MLELATATEAGHDLRLPAVVVVCGGVRVAAVGARDEVCVPGFGWVVGVCVGGRGEGV